MHDQQKHHYRKQANDVIRLTICLVREERRRLGNVQPESADYIACTAMLAELEHRLASMISLRKSAGAGKT